MTELYVPDRLKANAVAAAAIAMSGEDGAKARERLAEEGSKAKAIPAPTGYRILVAIPKAEETFDNGLFKADRTRMEEEVMTTVGLVVAMGPDCYHDKVRFPNGPYCKIGDFVVMRAYSGTRVRIYGKEWRLINDDTVEAVVEDPRGISRI